MDGSHRWAFNVGENPPWLGNTDSLLYALLNTKKNKEKPILKPRCIG